MRWLLWLLAFMGAGCSELLGLDQYGAVGSAQATTATGQGGGAGAAGGAAGMGGAGGGGGVLPSCAGTEQLRDHFERNVSSGWGMPDLGSDWVVNGDVEFGVADGSGTIKVTGTQFRTAVSNEAAATVAIVGKIRWDIPSDAFYRVNGGLQLRAAGGAYLEARITHQISQQPTFNIVFVNQTEGTSLMSVVLPGAGWSEDGYWVRFEATGVQPAMVRARAWQVGAPEPAAWDLETQAPHVDVPASGGFGASAYIEQASTGVTIFFDDIVACSE